jgi:diguanylate cyclase
MKSPASSTGANLAPTPLGEPLPAWGVVDRISLPWVALALVLLTAALAAGLQWALQAWMPPAPWLAPLAAALAVGVAALPTAALAHRLARGSASHSNLGSIHNPIGATRPLFMELAGREWARSRRYGTGSALLLVDVDRFARIVESRGGVATDAVLAELLRQTSPTLRGADLLTRFSEAQMGVFLAQADATGALDVAERIRERTEQMEVPFEHDASQRRLRVTVSVGVAQLRPAHLNLQALIDDAQDAVLAARQAGGNCVRAAPVDLGRLRQSGNWRDDHRARPN